LKKGSIVLDDTKTIYASGIVSGTVITADYNSISITVQIGEEEVELAVDPDNKV
jgi:hypothetical protein